MEIDECDENILTKKDLKISLENMYMSYNTRYNHYKSLRGATSLANTSS